MTTTIPRLALLLAALPWWAGCEDAAPSAEERSRTPVPLDPSWTQHVLAQRGAYIVPAAVEVEGDPDAVTHPEGLLAEGGGATTLTITGDGSARVVVDLGKIASGVIELGVTAAAGAPIRMSYAEYRPYLRREGDASTDPDDFFYLGRTLGADDDPDGRADVFAPPAAAAVLSSPALRGSQRYIAITLDGPGTATLDFVRVRQTSFAAAYDGHFLSSDDELNRAWYASAYAIDLSTARDTHRNPGGRWVIIDGPKRDRLVYAGDLRLVAQSAYYQGAGSRSPSRPRPRPWAASRSRSSERTERSRWTVGSSGGTAAPPATSRHTGTAIASSSMACRATTRSRGRAEGPRTLEGDHG